MTSNEELITFIKAEIAGKIIQILHNDNTGHVKVGYWDALNTYRIKPESRQWYVNEYAGDPVKGLGYLHETEALATNARDTGCLGTIKVREVLDD